MTSQELFNVIPKPARRTAATFLAIAVTVGIAAGAYAMHMSHGGHPVVKGMVGLGMGILVGTCFALFTLALGYVYADARRRNMPAVPWTLIALFVPNLLGFLLYFVLRKPIASPCPQCGQPITPDQRFCAFCGYQQPFPPTGAMVPSPPPL